MIMNSPAFKEDGLLIVTFEEGDVSTLTFGQRRHEQRDCGTRRKLLRSATRTEHRAAGGKRPAAGPRV